MQKNILLTNGGGIHSQSISDHVIGISFMKTRSLFPCVVNQQNNHWTTSDIIFKNLNESRILIVGTGQIGCEIARKFHFFESEVIGIKTTGNKETYSLDKLYDQAKKADIIINCLPLTSTTHHLYGKDFFQE